MYIKLSEMFTEVGKKKSYLNYTTVLSQEEIDVNKIETNFS